MNTKRIIIGSVGVLAVAYASFWGGMTYEKSSVTQAGQFVQNGQLAGRQGGGFRSSGNGAIFGTIVSENANSMTVELGGPNASSTNGTDTGSKIVFFDKNTQVGKFVAGSPSDLSAGESVLINGTPNSDGSVTATNIQIRPQRIAR